MKYCDLLMLEDAYCFKTKMGKSLGLDTKSRLSVKMGRGGPGTRLPETSRNLGGRMRRGAVKER